MVVKSLYYLMAIFSAIFLSVLIQEPYLVDNFTLDKSTAKVTMQNVVNYELTAAEVKSITKAKDIIRYKDKDMAYDVQVLLRKNDYIYSFEGEVGSLMDNIVTFSKNVSVNRSDGMVYRSKKLSYNMKQNTVSSSVNFTVQGGDMDINGSSFRYDIKQKVITADNVFAKFNVEES